MQILTKPSWRRRLLIVMGIQTFAQLTGINCVQYYAGTYCLRLFMRPLLTYQSNHLHRPWLQHH
jgi:hypothetical protein